MEVAGTDADAGRKPIAEEAGIRFVDDLMELAAESDMMTFHVPAIPQTENLISDDLLGVMKPGSVIINSSRGNILDEDALITAMNERDLKAGVDVYKG